MQRSYSIPLRLRKGSLASTRHRHPQERYKSIPGIVNTAVGYTGGTTANPTYDTVCRNDGHTEAIKVEFDPSVISYEQLMRTFFSEAGGGGGKTQYQSAVWPQTEEQKAVAQRLAAEKQSTVPVLKPTEWFDAEDHHQVRPAATPPAAPRRAAPRHATAPFLSSRAAAAGLHCKVPGGEREGEGRSLSPSGSACVLSGARTVSPLIDQTWSSSFGLQHDDAAAGNERDTRDPLAVETLHPNTLRVQLTCRGIF